MKIRHTLFFLFISLNVFSLWAVSPLSTTQATNLTLKSSTKIDELDLTISQGSQYEYILSTSIITALRTALNNLGVDVNDFSSNYLKSSEHLQDYKDPANISSSSNIYFYAIYNVPGTNKGSLKYYATSSSTNDGDFGDNTLTHYYTYNLEDFVGVLSKKDAEEADFKVAYDIENAKFIFKISNNCPVKTYNKVRFAFLRKRDSNYYLAYFTFNVKVQSAPSIILSDEVFSYEQLSGVYNVTLQRNFPAGKWLSFCSPFDIHSSEWIGMGIDAVCRLCGVEKVGEDVTLLFEEEVDEMKSDTPYLIKMEEERDCISKIVDTFNPHSDTPIITVKTDDAAITAQMVGTYVKIELPNDAYYLQDDIFRHIVYTSDQKTSMKAWRAYFTIISSSEVKGLKYSIAEKDFIPTDIEVLDIDMNNNTDVYTLTGQKVNCNALNSPSLRVLPKGFFIVGGKKLFIK